MPPNGTNLGLFKISFSTCWRPAPKCTESDLKKSHICPIWGQSDPIWMANLKSVMRIDGPGCFCYLTTGRNSRQRFQWKTNELRQVCPLIGQGLLVCRTSHWLDKDYYYVELRLLLTSFTKVTSPLTVTSYYAIGVIDKNRK